VAAVVYLAATRFGANERWAWAIAGFVFGIFAVSFWDQSFGVAVIAAPMMVAGAYLGSRAFEWLLEPTWPRLRALAAVALALPLLTGMADLFMRWTTA
jgi:hypothetical protein